MNFDTFLSLSQQEIAAIVQAVGPKVCACPINGTRRWYFLEHASQNGKKAESEYLDIMLDKYIEIFSLFFAYGIDTILTPIFGPDLLRRGDEYLGVAIQGMRDMVTNEHFLKFVHTNQVRVRFYGDFVRFFHGTQFEFLIDLFEKLTAETLHHTRHRLLWGVFGHDATERIAEIGVMFYQDKNRLPSRKEIIEHYFGEDIAPVSLFIGFDKLSAFDMPILATGEEDLYFTTSPTPYLTDWQFRSILFDHLYSRKGEPNYADFNPDDWERMHLFYDKNREKTIGVGVNIQGIWYPLSQVDGIEKLYLLTESPAKKGV